MSQILTQEELKTLLALVDGGEAAAGSTPHVPVAAQPFDFHSRSRLSSRDLALLEGALARTVRVHAPAIGRLLRQPITIEPPTCEQLPAKAFLESLPAPCLLYVLELRPMVSRGALVLEPAFATAAVDRMLGGSSDSGPARPALTPAVIGLARLLADKLLESVESAVREHAALDVAIAHLETDPHLSRALSPQDPLVIFRLEVESEGIAGSIHVALPAQALASGLRDEDTKGQRQRPRALDESSPVATMPIDVSAVVGEVPLSLGALLDLEEGDIIRLRLGADEPMEVRFSGVTRFLGQAGTRRGRNVIKLAGRVSGQGASV